MGEGLVSYDWILKIPFGLAIVFGIFADSIYHKRIKEKIAVAQRTTKNEAQLLNFLKSKSGVHDWVMWLSASPIIGIIASIAIPAFVDHKTVRPPAAVAESLSVNTKPAIKHREGNCISGDCTNGQGVWIYSSGVKLEGLFKNEELEQGTLTAPDGTTQSGKFTSSSDGDLLQYGLGTYISPSGAKYVGEFKNGQKEGQGTINYADGETYIGEFKNGKYEG